MSDVDIITCNICYEDSKEYLLPCENCKHLKWYICDTCIIKMQMYQDSD